jgi:hypothetical protein
VACDAILREGMKRRQERGIGPLTNIFPQPGAWYVSIIRGGRLYVDYFSHAVWGGNRKALVAAQRFRDELLSRIPPDTRTRRRMPKGARRGTGIVGVTKETYTVQGRKYERYVASWQDDQGRHMRRRFLVQRYGDELARLLAVGARQAGVSRRHTAMLERQREEARRRLRDAPPMPRQVKDPLSRKGINMANRGSGRR